MASCVSSAMATVRAFCCIETAGFLGEEIGGCVCVWKGGGGVQLYFVSTHPTQFLCLSVYLRLCLSVYLRLCLSVSVSASNSKHRFTTSFLQPLPYLVTP